MGIPDLGYGVPVSALPAIPEWTNVNGAPTSFAIRREQGVRARKADFIIAVEGEYEDLLTSSGYVRTGIKLTREDTGLAFWNENVTIWQKKWAGITEPAIMLLEVAFSLVERVSRLSCELICLIW